jgi:hypothetical protein
MFIRDEKNEINFLTVLHLPHTKQSNCKIYISKG